MIYRSTPKFVTRFAEIIEKRQLKIELIGLFSGLLGLLIGSFQKDIGELILNFSLITLACTYYFLAFKQTNNKYDRFTIRLINLSYSVAVISILFVLLSWPGGLMIHQMGMISLLISLLSIIFLDKIFKKTSKIDNTTIIRTFIILGLLLLLHFSLGYAKLRELENKYQSEIKESE